VAITGSLPQKSDNPAVPITIAEQVESTHEAFEAGRKHRPLPCARTTRGAQAPTLSVSGG
jgi:hypothetical protein